jgi:hypothetical protein
LKLANPIANTSIAKWNDHEQSELGSLPASCSKYEGKSRGEGGAIKKEKIILMINTSVEKPANSIKPSAFSAANNFSACQEISHTFWFPNVHHLVPNSPSHSLYGSKLRQSVPTFLL